MSDERRERYEEAIYATFRSVPYVSVLIERATDDAMAVADEENASLRAELRSCQEARDVADRGYEEEARDNASLRAELAEVRRNFHRELNDAANLHAAVSRVRAVLSELDEMFGETA